MNTGPRMQVAATRVIERRNVRRFQYLVALVLLALFTAGFLERMSTLAAANERIAAEQSVVMLNTMLTQVVVQHAVRGRLNDLHRYADTNPMTLLEAQAGQTPANYAGELAGGCNQHAPAGAWHYCLDTRELVYRFVSSDARLRLRLRAVYGEVQSGRRADPASAAVTGLRLQRLETSATTLETT